VVAISLPPLLDIEATAADAALSARVQPLLVSLFTLNDRGVRAMLLSKVDTIAPRLDAATLNNRLFDPLCAGFMDAAAQLRELTLKSMVVLVDKLSDKNLNDKLLRHLGRLQVGTRGR
jgi:SCY1-like protein 1